MAVRGGLDIIGFTLAPGNIPQVKSSENLKIVQEFLGTNIKMYKGQPDKKTNQETAEYAHGVDGLGYYAFPSKSNKKYERTKAENFIIKSAKKYKDDLTLVCLGSSTNLYNALKKKKSLKKFGKIIFKKRTPRGRSFSFFHLVHGTLFLYSSHTYPFYFLCSFFFSLCKIFLPFPLLFCFFMLYYIMIDCVENLDYLTK